nr:glycosyltransferase family 87 protein [uncultured Sphingomonas sp.]
MTVDIGSAVTEFRRRAGEAILAIPGIRRFWRNWRVEYGFALLFLTVLLVAWIQINTPGKFPDFTVFHAAATHSQGPVYDSAYLTPLQDHAAGEERPFAYPPTFLLMIVPLGWLSFKTAFSVWVAVSVTAYVGAGWRMTKASWLALWSPTFLFAAVIGQTTLMVGGMAIWGFTLLDRRPRLGGAIFGAAICVKPQLFLFLPLLLIMSRQWRTIGTATVTGGVIAVAATINFGPQIWGQWLGSIAQFVATNDRQDIVRLGVPPSSLWFYVILIVATALLWRHRNGPRSQQALLVLGASILLSPHAAFYESAVLIAPAFAVAGLSWRLVPAFLLLLIPELESAWLAMILLAISWPVGNAIREPRQDQHRLRRTAE